MKEVREKKEGIEKEMKGIVGERKEGFVGEKKVSWWRLGVEGLEKEKLKREEGEM